MLSLGEAHTFQLDTYFILSPSKKVPVCDGVLEDSLLDTKRRLTWKCFESRRQDGQILLVRTADIVVGRKAELTQMFSESTSIRSPSASSHRVRPTSYGLVKEVREQGQGKQSSLPMKRFSAGISRRASC